MKKGIAAILALLMVLGIGAVPAMATAVEEASEGYGETYVLYGDVTIDEGIDATDALAVLKCAVGKQKLDEVQTEVANVNKDDKINAEDALLILRFSVGKIKEFPAGERYVIKKVGPIEGFDKSNSVNGAYVKDETADCSFVSDVSSLQPYTIYRMSSTVFGGDMKTDSSRLIFSLQGLINRDFGMDEEHTVLLYSMSDGSDKDWLEYMTLNNEKSIFQAYDEKTGKGTMREVRINTWDDFYETFFEVIKKLGIILWDGNVPATSNVAATICGLEGYLPVLAQSPLHEKLKKDGVEEKQTLVGLFENGKKGSKINGTSIDSTGSAKNDAYLWALEKYFDRCTSGYLAYILDGACTIKGYDAYEDNPTALLSDAGSNCLSNHDYLIARRCFFFDLAVNKDELACDDPAQKNGQADAGIDHDTMMKIFAARYKRANGAFGQLMGFPPWWLKYTSHHNQGGMVATTIEWLFTEYVTCYNLAKEADAAQPSSMTNGSAYYKYVPHTNQYTNNHTKEDLAFDKDTYYYTIYVGDYDSSAWMKTHVHSMWMRRGGDRARGKVALMWSFNPNLSYRVPMAFDYVYENKTDKDYFAAGDSGAGYIIPEGLFTGKNLAYMNEPRPSENADAGQVWADYCKAFYQRFDLQITGFIINGANYTVSKDIAASFNQFSTVGSFTNCIGTTLGKYKDVPYVYCQNGIGVGNSAGMYSHATSTLGKGVNFSAYRTVCLTPSEINNIVNDFAAYATEKGMKVKYCDPYTYFDVLKQSGQGTEIQ